MKVLLVDSDSDMSEMLGSWLKTRGYEVQHAFTGERTRTLWLEHQPDIVILDVSLRDTNAFALLRDLRTKHDALVLATSDAQDVQTEVECLNAGADAYLRRPFYPAQLLAHINSLTRRVRTTLDLRPSSVLTVGPFRIESLRNQVMVGNTVITLTPTESKILHLLAANANTVCTLGQIVSHVWGFGNSGDTYLVKAHIRHLREKLEQDPANPQYISTVTGVGYSLRRTPAYTRETSSSRGEATDTFAELAIVHRHQDQDTALATDIPTNARPNRSRLRPA